jgi:hypothetical protein
MRLVEYTARDVQEIMQPFADQLVRRIAYPAAKGLVRFCDTPVHLQRNVPARRIFVEVFEVVFYWASLRQSYSSRR